MKPEIALVLGAGRSQIPVMSLCRKYGKKVLSVAPRGNYPGFSFADYVEYCDVREEEKILEIARQYEICAILSEQLDEAVPTAAYVSERLGIKGIPYKVALSFRNKSLMLEKAMQAGVSVPEFVTVGNLEDAILLVKTRRGLDYPLIMKPVDSSASRGVCRVNNQDELERDFQESIRWSKDGKVIIEKYIQGDNYCVDAYTHNFKTTNLDIGIQRMFEIPGMFITRDVCNLDAESAAHNPVDGKVLATNKKLVEAMGLPFGITHGEYIYSKEDEKVYLIEVAARGGGAFISSDIVPAASGINMNDLYVREVLRMEINEDFIVRKGAAGFVCYLLPQGKIADIHNTDAVEKHEGVMKAFFDNISIGLDCPEIENKASRKGPILVRGETREDCYRIMEEVKKLLQIDVMTSDGIKGIMW